MTSNFPNKYAETVTVGGVPILQTHAGEVFWVNNSGVLPKGGKGGSDGNSGTYKKPFATLDYAVSKCTANRGDIIFIAPGHAETLSAADAIDLDVAGISVIGLGTGTLRPTFTIDNAAGEFTIGADNITVKNIVINASVTSITKGFNIELGVDYTNIIDCKLGVDAAGTDELTTAIYLEGTNVGAVIEGCVINQGIAAANAAIFFDAVGTDCVVRNNRIYGDYAVANIYSDTTALANVLITGNLLVNGIGGNLGALPAISLLTGSTGVITDNYIVCNLATIAASVVADTCLLFQNYYNEDISGAATGGIIGAASADD